MDKIELLNKLINQSIEIENEEKKSYLQNFEENKKVNFKTKSEIISFISERKYKCSDIKFINYQINKILGKKILPGYSSKKDLCLKKLIKYITRDGIVKKSFCIIEKKTNKKEIKKYQIDYLLKYKKHCGNAKQRGIINYLTYQEYEEICKGKCYLCKEDNSGGIDRKKSNLDYTKENSKPCCSMCNSIKSSFRNNIFLDKIKKILFNI